MTDGRVMTGSPLARAARLRWYALRRPIKADADLQRLARLFRALNARYFGGRLPELPLRISGRMTRRLGQLTLERKSGRPVEIAISRTHLERHAWDEIAHTLLHEMVHLWQWQAGLKVDHGPAFRRMARAVGITPAARRAVRDVVARA